MSEVIKWLSEEMGRALDVPDQDQSMVTLREQVLSGKRVVIFGAGAGGDRTYSLLVKYGVSVEYFLDNNVKGEKYGVPVYSLADAPVNNLPILISSAWFVEIGQQIYAAGLYNKGAKALPLPDVLQIESNIYDDMAGWPFFSILESRLDDFKKVADLWDDKASRNRFIKLLNYRLNFFTPHKISIQDLPCTSAEYASGVDVKINLPIPEKISDEAKGLIQYQLDHLYGQHPET